MDGEYGKISCIIMASGLSERYGKNKLLEKLGGREVILHTAGSLIGAGFSPVTVTRSTEVKALMDRKGFACVLHDGPKKSDTIHIGIGHTSPDAAGYLFMPGDQPLVRPESLKKMAEQFLRSPDRAVRLSFEGTPGSPVLFPTFCREKLMAYTGDRGGIEVLKAEHIPCDCVEAGAAWELWDVDTPESMEKVRKALAESAGTDCPESFTGGKKK